jgi:hypothetical protein
LYRHILHIQNIKREPEGKVGKQNKEMYTENKWKREDIATRGVLISEGFIAR